MPTPLSPSSSQEIVAISPPPNLSTSKSKSTTSSKCGTSSSSRVGKGRNVEAQSVQSSAKPLLVDENAPPSASASGSVKGGQEEDRDYNYARGEIDVKGKDKGKGKGKRKVDAEAEQRERSGKYSRSRVTEQMMSTLGKGANPITNSDLYSRTDHFVSCATGHQQSNRGGGSAGAAPYWKVRTEKILDQSRDKTTSILSDCLFYINGSTGPKLSNLQLQHLITSNGGRFSPVQSSHCTHIIANGGLSGTKSQKWIDGQGSRGAAMRSKVVTVDWVIDSVHRGIKLSEANYTVLDDPSQPNLFKTLGVKPKS